MYGEHWLGNDSVHRYTKSQPLSEMFIAATGFQEGQIGEVKMNNFTLRDKYKRLYSGSVVTAELVVDSLQMCEDWERQRNSNFMTIDSGEKDNYCSLTNKGTGGLIIDLMFGSMVFIREELVNNNKQ